MLPSGWLGPTWHLFWTLGICPGWLSRNSGYFFVYWTRPPSVGGSIPRHYRYKLQLDGAMVQYMCTIFVRTSLGALLSMMMNVALKSELLVESWA